jgi:outer membrane protein assembly factor BamA
MRGLLLLLIALLSFQSGAQPSQDTTYAIPYDCSGIPYSEDTYYIIDSITLSGNKVTRDHIILRELMFQHHDSICRKYFSRIVQKSRENLLNTSLFNFVTVDTVPSGMRPNGMSVRLKFIERWYIWPLPIFELSDRNFNAWLEDMDLYKISYGVNITWDNFRGRREKVNLFLRFGYDQKYDLYYMIPYIDKGRRLGIGFGGGVALNHEVSYQTENNKLVYYRDEGDYVRSQGFSYLQLSYRKNYYNQHEVRFSFNYDSFDDTLLMLNPGYSSNLDRILRYFTLYYRFKSDHRDSKPYPLEGYYFDAGFSKIGLGLIPDNDLNILYVLSTFRKYWKLNERFYYAFGLNAKFSNEGQQPYFLTWGFGYGRDYVRSYELYVVDGQNFGLFKTNLKFALVKPREFNLKFIPTEKFSKIHFALYMNLFTDLGFTSNAYYQPGLNNRLENQLLIGYGLGLDFVTYYDIVIRLEFSANKQWEKGIFIHFEAPI